MAAPIILGGLLVASGLYKYLTQTNPETIVLKIIDQIVLKSKKEEVLAIVRTYQILVLTFPNKLNSFTEDLDKFLKVPQTFTDEVKKDRIRAKIIAHLSILFKHYDEITNAKDSIFALCNEDRIDVNVDKQLLLENLTSVTDSILAKIRSIFLISAKLLVDVFMEQADIGTRVLEFQQKLAQISSQNDVDPKLKSALQQVFNDLDTLNDITSRDYLKTWKSKFETEQITSN